MIASVWYCEGSEVFTKHGSGASEKDRGAHHRNREVTREDGDRERACSFRRHRIL